MKENKTKQKKNCYFVNDGQHFSSLLPWPFLFIDLLPNDVLDE